MSVVQLQACGTGAVGDVENTHPTQQAPSSAPKIFLERNNKHQLILNWNEQSGVENYTLYLSTSELFDANETTKITLDRPPHIITADDNGQQYFVRIKSNWSNNESPDSKTLTFTVPPKIPVNFTSEVNNKNSIKISWDVVEAVDSYTLYRNMSDVFDIDTAIIVENVSSPYEDNALIPNQNYYYWVVANRDEQISAFSNVSVAMVNEDVIENRAPVITSSSEFSISENSGAITVITATDVDSENLTFSIVGGPDASLFTINSNNGALLFNNPPDYLIPEDSNTDNIYQLDIEVSDGSNIAQQSLQVAVLNIDEVLPEINFSQTNVSVSEEDGVATLSLKLDKADTQNNIAVSINTVPGTASLDDYATLNNQLITLPAGSKQLSFDVKINDDSLHEGPNTESFTVVLSSVTGATLGSQSTVAIAIIDNEPLVAGPKVLATSPGSEQKDVDITLNKIDVTFDIDMDVISINVDTFRVSHPDGSPVSGTVTYDQSTKTASFSPINTWLSNELYRIELRTDIKDVSGESLAAVFTSRFSTALTKVSMEDVSVDEENTNLTMTISLNSASASPITFDYATANGTATEANEDGVNDYEAKTGNIVFNVGETEKTITLKINDDEIYETDETLLINLSNIQGAILDKTNIQVTIIDNNDLPSLSLEDVTVNESDTIAAVSVKLSKASDFMVQVDYVTENNSAIDGNDYEAKSGTLRFTPGVSSDIIIYNIKDDVIVENDEQFIINLSNVVGATISDGQSLVTIRNDDVPFAPALSLLNGNAQVTLNWADVSGATSYNVYYAQQSGVTPDNYSAMDGTMLLDQSSGLVLSDLKLWVDYHFVITALANNLESTPSVEKSVRVMIVPSKPLNDTGITFGGYSPYGNSPIGNCNGVAVNQQDCSQGRDSNIAQNDNIDGHSGFNFTKLDANGNSLSADATEWFCVKDNVTGLLWEVKQGGNSVAADEGLHDSDDRYNWYDTNPNTNGGIAGYADDDGAICDGYDVNNPASFCNTESFVQRVNQAGYCGINDWRMPTRGELLSIMNYNKYSPSVDTNYFPKTISSGYWSISMDGNPVSYARVVNFSDGNIHISNHANNNYIRLVRSGVP